MKLRKNKFWLQLTIIFISGLFSGVLCQFFAKKPTSKHIHVRNFRYGKDPSVIRCNRGDSLKLTFSTDDTGHSFFLEEFDMDVKVSPATESVTVFKTSDPTETPEITKEVSFKAEHGDIAKYLVSKSHFRCHVWCGPMHAFEQGKLVIFPNTLLFFSLGCLLSILILWITALLKPKKIASPHKDQVDLLKKYGILNKLIKSRWPQVILTLLTLLMIYVVLITTFFGTKMSGRNFGVLMMWAIWLFLLVAVLTPLFGRIWCTVCPMPFFGEWFQRKSLFKPETGKTKKYYNAFSGLFLKWPKSLSNSWVRLITFMILSTFSTTLVANPWASGLAVLLLILLPTIMSFVFELRAFCRYVCPVTVFVSPFSALSPVAIQSKSDEQCNKCKGHFCEKGSKSGWACPYGLNVGTMNGSTECGLCMECLRSCSYNNVTLIKRPFGGNTKIKGYSEAWVAIAIFSMSIIYSVVYLGTWPEIRDYVNILDKQNWDLFGIYTLVVWISVLLVIPGFIYSLALFSKKMSKAGASTKEIFFSNAGSLVPMGMMLWIAFVLPMLFVNITFIMQAASDPFGWGWDFFGTAGIPWHQFLPEFVPWFQAILVLVGLQLSLAKIKQNWSTQYSLKQYIKLSIPIGLFLFAAAIFMLFFFTN